MNRSEPQPTQPLDVPVLYQRRGAGCRSCGPFLGAVWRSTAGLTGRVKEALTDVAATLAACPQPGGSVPVLRGVFDYGEDDEVPTLAPISYELLRERLIPAFDIDGVTVIQAIHDELAVARETRPRAPSPSLPYLKGRSRRATSVRGLSKVGPRTHRLPMNPQLRPNDVGGRQVTATETKAEQALAVFHKSLTLIKHERLGRRQLHVFSGDPTSDGAGLIRLSTDDLKGGETAKGQLVAQRKLLENHKMPEPRYWVVETATTGFSKWDQRLGLKWLEPHLGRSVNWVSVRDPDRVGRDKETVGHFYSLLQERFVKLYYWFPFGRAINWATDELQLDMLHVFATNEGRTIKRRTHGALVQRYLLEGRGWAGTKRFGLTRDADGYLAPAPAGMEHVLWMALRYNEIAKSGKGGYKQVAREVADRTGVHLSAERVRQILRDPIYVTGEWFVHYHGYRVACRRVELGPWAVARPLFLENQQLLGLKRGHNVNTAIAESLLNHVLFLHGDCMHLRGGARQEVPRLMAYRQRNGKDPNYSHKCKPHDAPASCHGLSVPKGPIEGFVVRTLLDIIRSDAVRRAYAEAVKAEADEQEFKPSAEELAAARRTVAEAEARLAELDLHLPGEPGRYQGWTEERWMDYRDIIRLNIERAKAELAEVEERAFEVPAFVRALADAEDTDFVRKVERVLTVHTPEDPQTRMARAAVFSSLVERVVLHTTHDGWFIEMFGPIAPNGLRATGPLNPLQAADDELRDLEAAGMLDEQSPGANPDGLDIEDECPIVAMCLAGTDDEASKQADPCLDASSSVSGEAELALATLQPPPCMSYDGSTMTEFLRAIDRRESPASFRRFDADQERRGGVKRLSLGLLETPPGHGPAWATPRLPLAIDRARNTKWTYLSVMAGLVRLVRAIDPECVGMSLTTPQAVRLVAADHRIPRNVPIGKVAAELGTTSHALREAAREHVIRSNSARAAGLPEPLLPAVSELAGRELHFGKSFWTEEALLAGLCAAVRELDPMVTGAAPLGGMAYRRLSNRDPRVPQKETLTKAAGRLGLDVPALYDDARRRVWAERVAGDAAGALPLKWPGVDRSAPSRWTLDEVIAGLCRLIRQLDPDLTGRKTFKYREHATAHQADARIPHRCRVRAVADRNDVTPEELYRRAYAALARAPEEVVTYAETPRGP